MASRNNTYKTKPTLDKREKKLLRVHRRSIDQREQRHGEVNKRRQLDNMSPVVESADGSKNPSHGGTPRPVPSGKAAISRLDMLKKWKEERELKRKLEALEKGRNKPGFRVTHVNHDDKKLFKNEHSAPTSKQKSGPVSTTLKPGNPKPAPAKVATAPARGRGNIPAVQGTKPAALKAKPTVATTRVTRSKAAATVPMSPAQKKLKALPSQARLRSPRGRCNNFMAPTAASKTRAAVSVNARNVMATKSSFQANLRDTSKVSTGRGDNVQPSEPSFAPSDFVFEAPQNVPSFVFQPLSPNSAANFLYPSSNSTSMSLFTDRVGSFVDNRTSTPKGKRTLRLESDDSQATVEEQASRDDVSDSAEKTGSVSADQQPKKDDTRMSSSLVSGKEVVEGHVDEAIRSKQSLVEKDEEESSAPATDKENLEMSSCTKMQAEAQVEQKSRTPADRCESSQILQQTTPAQVEDEVQEEQLPASSSTSRRRSTRKQNKNAISEAESVAEDEKPVLQKKLRRSSRRSTAESVPANQDKSQPMEAVDEEDAAVFDCPEDDTQADKEEKATPGRTLRRSHRSSVVNPGTLVSDNTKDSNISTTNTPRKLGRSRRSSAAPLNTGAESASKTPVINTELDRHLSAPVTAQTGDMSDMAERLESERQPQHASPATAEAAQRLKRRRSADCAFRSPGLPLSVQKQSATKRRRTATMIALSSAKSPEEAIKIISNSPMVEMTRRTPKLKTTPAGMNSSTRDMFEDVDMLLAKPMRLFAETSPEDEPSAGPAAAVPSECPGEAEATRTETGSDVQKKRDVTTFRERHLVEIAKLTALAEKWTAIETTTPGLTEEAQGQIRTVACQARLLMAEKLKQFSGLVDSCEAGDPTTLCQDLQGFWDMVYIQAEDVYKKFESLEKLQQNNWKFEEPTVKQKVPAKKKAAFPKKVKPAGKSKFAEFKAQLMKQQKTAATAEEKVFDAGFFRVNSPVKTPPYHCDGGTPQKHKTPSIPSSALGSADTVLASSDKLSSSEKTPGQLPALENKENMHIGLLRRSVGRSPFRRSCVPAVPSPLLQDTTCRDNGSPVSSRRSGSKRRISALSEKADQSVAEGGNGGMVEETAHHVCLKSTPRRRSTRARKSVCFTADGEKFASPTPTSKTVEEPVDFMAYFQPSITADASPLQASNVEYSPFSCESILLHSGKNSANTSLQETSVTPHRRLSASKRKSSLKKLPSAEKRKSRRSVSFAVSPAGVSQVTHTLPSTPYNRDSLLAGRRVLRRSTANQRDIQSTPPQLRRSARPSLLYTPPKMDKLQNEALHKDVPVATLISFSP